MRKLALALPGAHETFTWGHPQFRVDGKIFAAWGPQAGRECVCVKVGKPRQKELLREGRYLYADYVGRFGWVAFPVEGRVDWNEVAELLITSYRLIAPKRRLVELERPEVKKVRPAKGRRAGAKESSKRR